MGRVRIPDPVLEVARLAGQTSSRSAEEQVAHWVRLGRSIERSGLYSHLEITDLLARCDISGAKAPDQGDGASSTP
jgi:hypothetical protein